MNHFNIFHATDYIKKDSTENVVDQESVSLLDESTLRITDDNEDESKNGIQKGSRTATISSIEFIDDNVSIYGFETPISLLNGSLLDIRGS